MGYFNYFIKCVIRKFVNMLFKPKMILAFLIIIGLLFAMNITSRAEWTDTQIQQTIEDLESIAGMTYESYKELEQVVSRLDNLIVNTGSISTDVVLIRNTLGEIKGQIDNLLTNDANFLTKVDEIASQLENVSTEITNIYNKLDENQQELLTELEKDNQAVLEELNMIRDALNGTEDELTSYSDLGIITNSSSNVQYTLKGISINYQPKYTYKIKIYYNNPFRWSYACWCFCY